MKCESGRRGGMCPPFRFFRVAATGILAWGTVASFASAQRMVDVELRVESDQVPAGASVYVAGNLPELGNWSPGDVAMAAAGEQAWRKELTVPEGTRIEYKYTLGSWVTEALNDAGWVPGNHVLMADTDTSVVTKVLGWNNHGKMPEGGITGEARYHRGVEGEGLLARDIVVWLPPGYDQHPEQRYPVLYAQDGQNLFDPATSYLGVDWGLDETATKLIGEGKMEPVIMVGIYNTIDRDEEYTHSEKGQAYMDFVTRVVKPMIDAAYRTLPDRDNTSVIGASAGGLISFLLAWEHPDVFGQAACLSPAFLHGGPRHAVRLVAEGARPAQPLRFYIDNGTGDLEQRLQPGCEMMLKALSQIGYGEGKDFIWFQDEGAQHGETAWGRRAWRPLTFFYGGDRG